MRALVALSLLALLVPVASAEPFDCTGTGRPSTLNGTGMDCDRSTRPNGDTSTVRKVTVNADNDFAGAKLVYRHETVSNEDSVRSGCRIEYHHTAGLGINSFSMTAPACASHRVLA